MEYTCLINFFTENDYVYKEHNGVMHLYLEGTSTGINWIFRKNGNWGEVKIVDGKWKANGLGKWRCDGDSNFVVENTNTNKIFSSADENPNWKDKPQEEESSTNITQFSCVTNGLTSAGISFEIKDNIYVVATLKSGTKWYFYQPKQGTKPWVEVNNKTITLQGTWSCVGESNFQLTRSDGKTYVGGDTSWKESTQTEPTYDKSKFPLKVGSEGPEVAQLQNYLNKIIPFEPLAVNGLFDKKTQDKLIQLQKSLNITK